MNVDDFVRRYNSLSSAANREETVRRAEDELNNEQLQLFAQRVGLVTVDPITGQYATYRPGGETQPVQTPAGQPEPEQQAEMLGAMGLSPGDPFPIFEEWVQYNPGADFVDYLFRKDQYERGVGSGPTLGGLTAPERVARSLEMAPGETATEFAEQAAQRTMAAEQAAVSFETGEQLRSQQLETVRRGGLTSNEFRNEFLAAAEDYRLLARYGIPQGDLARSIRQYFAGEPGTLQKFIEEQSTTGFNKQQIRDSLVAFGQGTAYAPSVVSTPQLEAGHVNRARKYNDPDLGVITTDRVGLTDAEGNLLYDSAGNEIKQYNENSASAFLYTQLNPAQRETLLDRLVYANLLQDRFNPVEVLSATKTLLGMANSEGLQYQTLLDEIERGTYGSVFDPDLFRRREQEERLAAANAAAFELLGRELTAEEERQIGSSMSYFRRQYGAAVSYGVSPDPSGRMLGPDDVTKQWLQTNRPEEMKLYERLPYLEQIWELWRNGEMTLPDDRSKEWINTQADQAIAQGYAPDSRQFVEKMTTGQYFPVVSNQPVTRDVVSQPVNVVERGGPANVR